MKKLIILLLLVGCKKATTPTPTVTAPIVTAVPDKTVSISCQTGCGGQLRVIWEYDYQDVMIDSVYTYTPTKIFTKIVTGDSIRIYFFSSVCSTCSPCVSQVTLYVNGVVNKSWSNDNGMIWNLIKL